MAEAAAGACVRVVIRAASAHLLLHVMTCYSLPRQFDMPAGDSAPRSPGGHGLAREHTLLENGLWAPAEKGLRHRFPNRCPATATNGLALRHRISQPVP